MYKTWMWNDAKKNDIHWLLTLTKEEFLIHVLERLEIRVDGGANCDKQGEISKKNKTLINFLYISLLRGNKRCA